MKLHALGQRELCSKRVEETEKMCVSKQVVQSRVYQQKTPLSPVTTPFIAAVYDLPHTTTNVWVMHDDAVMFQ